MPIVLQVTQTFRGISQLQFDIKFVTRDPKGMLYASYWPLKQCNLSFCEVCTGLHVMLLVWCVFLCGFFYYFLETFVFKKTLEPYVKAWKIHRPDKGQERQPQVQVRYVTACWNKLFSLIYSPYYSDVSRLHNDFI